MEGKLPGTATHEPPALPHCPWEARERPGVWATCDLGPPAAVQHMPGTGLLSARSLISQTFC